MLKIIGILMLQGVMLNGTAATKEIFPTAQKILTQLRHQHYAQVPFRYDHWFCTQAMESFFKFVDLPETERHKFNGKLSSKHRRGDLGLVYRQKSQGDGYNDSKCFFHYHPKLRALHEQEIQKTPVVKDFMDRADLIWQEVYHTLDLTLTQFEYPFPGIKAKVLNTQEPHILVRFLRYDIQTPGHYLAKPHFDAGSMTFAIAESKPGLRLGSGPDDLKLVEHYDKQALFFLAANIGQLIDPTPLKPGWHDVIHVGERPSDNKYERWALVAFIDGHNTTGAPETVTHKWRVDKKLL
ncbi:MAG: hypothetical protein ACK5PQ_04645 [Alphaproteobacteria bacterium]